MASEPKYLAGCEDFDVVSFDNYSKDMGELRDHSVAIIANLRRELKQAQLLAWCFLKAAGGDLRFPVQWLTDPKPGHMEQTAYYNDMTIRFRAEQPPTAASDHR
jgi:hypothetical protein